MSKLLHLGKAALCLISLLSPGVRADQIALVDPSLEQGLGGTQGSVLSGWWTFDERYAFGGEALGLGSPWNMSNADGSRGAYAIQINENDGGSLYQSIELDAGTDYQFTVAVGMSAQFPRSDGKFAVVIFDQNFTTAVAETSGVITERGLFTDFTVEFTPSESGIYHVGMRNLGYVPGTGGNNNLSTLLFDNARLQAAGQINYPAALDLSSTDTKNSRDFSLSLGNATADLSFAIDKLTISGPDASYFTVLTELSSASPLQIEPGSDSVLQLRFDPRGRSAQFEATLEIHSNDPENPIYRVPLTGLVRSPWLPHPRSITRPYLPAPSPGVTVGEINETDASLSNDLIEVTWRQEAGQWALHDASNKLTGASLGLASPAPLFKLTLSDGSVLRSTDFNLLEGPTLHNLKGDLTARRHYDTLAGQEIRMQFISANTGLELLWRAELRNETHFVRQFIELSNPTASSLTLSSVSLVSMETPDFTIRGSVDGSPALSENFFIAQESPMAKTVSSTDAADIQIGTWAVNQISPPWSAFQEFDVSAWANLERLNIRFDYQSGPHRLNIYAVELLEDGQVVASDRHFGYAGLPSVENTYMLDVPAYDASKQYSLRAELDVGENFSESFGQVVLTGVPGNGQLESSVSGLETVTNTSSVRHSSVIGSLIPEQERRSFLAYVENVRAHPYRQYLHYNSWLDVSWEVAGDSIMTETNTLAAMQGHIDQLIAPFNEPYDGFVFDDGWDNWNSLWDFDPITFPRQFTPMDDLATTHGTGIGAWLSPFGGYGAARTARINFGQNQSPPYETNNGGFSLAGPNYYRAYRDRCLQMIADYDFSYFKFDGIGEGNGASGAGPEFLPDIRAILNLIGELRSARNDLFLNLTVGSWPSPFWLESVDSIWRAGADMGLRGEGNNHERWITYRDSECYNNVVGRAPLFPLNSVMLHGITWANNGPANDPDFNSASFKSDLRAYFGFGTGLQELYLSPTKLNETDWQHLAEGIKWSRENQAILADTHWIGGDPGQGEVYGWAAWRPDKGLITLRNPSSLRQDYVLQLDQAFELPPDAATAYYLKSPWLEDAETSSQLRAVDTAFILSLEPFEVITLEATPGAPPAWHSETSYRQWSSRLPSGSRRPEEAFGRSSFSNLFAFTAGLEPLEVAGEPELPFTINPAATGPELEYVTRESKGAFQLKPQVSIDLTQWFEGPDHFTEIERTLQSDGTERVRVRLNPAYQETPKAFVRLAASAGE